VCACACVCIPVLVCWCVCVCVRVCVCVSYVCVRECVYVCVLCVCVFVDVHTLRYTCIFNDSKAQSTLADKVCKHESFNSDRAPTAPSITHTQTNESCHRYERIHFTHILRRVTRTAYCI